MPELISVPSVPASPASIAEEDALLPHPVSAQYRALLGVWNGLDLEVIRFHGCADGACQRLSQVQQKTLSTKGLVVFGTDPSGFLYAEDPSGSCFVYDAKGGKLEGLRLAFDPFVERYVFGEDGRRFMGDHWVDELKDAGVIPD